MTDARAAPVETDRLRLRGARDGDLDGIVEIQTDVTVRRHLGGPRPEAADTDDMLGTVTLSRRAADLPGHVEDSGDELELSYVFRQRAWGRGHAAEAAHAALRVAAERLSDQAVPLITQSADDASLRLAERLGFSTVSTFEQFRAAQTLAVARLEWHGLVGRPVQVRRTSGSPGWGAAAPAPPSRS